MRTYLSKTVRLNCFSRVSDWISPTFLTLDGQTSAILRLPREPIVESRRIRARVRAIDTGIIEYSRNAARNEKNPLIDRSIEHRMPLFSDPMRAWVGYVFSKM